MKIEVSDHDISTGQRYSPSWCPVSNGLRRAGLNNPTTAYSYIQLALHPGHHNTIFPTPPEVTKFMKRYDNRLPVEPFTFELPTEPSQ